jgi:hypothetical protein
MANHVLTGTDMIKTKFIEKKIKELTDGYMVTDAIFMRDASDTPSITFEEQSNGLNDYEASGEVEERTEEGSYPRIGLDAETKQALIKDYGLEVLVTYEAIRFNQISSIDRAYIKLGNSLIKFIDTKGLKALTDNYNASSSRIHTQAAGTAFTAAGADPFGVFLSAKAKVDDSGYLANTILINSTDWTNALKNKDFRQELDRDVAPDRKIVKAGLLGGSIAGLTVVVARNMAPGFAWVGQDQVVGNRSETSNGVEVETYKNGNSKKASTVVSGYREVEHYLTDLKAGCLVSGLQ